MVVLHFQKQNQLELKRIKRFVKNLFLWYNIAGKGGEQMYGEHMSLNFIWKQFMMMHHFALKIKIK